MVGRTLAQYRIEEKLGKGGMGEVYEARDRERGENVALKTVVPKLTPMPVFFNIHCTVFHPNWSSVKAPSPVCS